MLQPCAERDTSAMSTVITVMCDTLTWVVILSCSDTFDFGSPRPFTSIFAIWHSSCVSFHHLVDMIPFPLLDMIPFPGSVCLALTRSESASLISYCCLNQEQLRQEAPSSTIDLTGKCPSTSELEEFLNSSEQQNKKRDTIIKLNRTNHLGTHGPEIMPKVRKHKQINTMEDQVLYSLSAAAESKNERKKLCSTISVAKGQDRTPLEEWDEQRLQDALDCMYCATVLANQLCAKRQHIPFTLIFTLFDPEKLPNDQKLILAQILASSSTIYCHVMMQMTTNPSLPIHAPDLSQKAKLLDAKNQILMTQEQNKY